MHKNKTYPSAQSLKMRFNLKRDIYIYEDIIYIYDYDSVVFSFYVRLCYLMRIKMHALNSSLRNMRVFIRNKIYDNNKLLLLIIAVENRIFVL